MAKKRKIKPTAKQAEVEQMFPAVAKWVQGCGHIEIGDQQSLGFVAQAIDYGGFVFQYHGAESLAEAMAALDKGLAEWVEQEGIE